MNNHKVSVLVPVYNSETFLERCIKSILKQTYKNLEVILVNDGSTDSSSEICEHYASLDSRIVFIHQKNLGVSKARNTAIKFSTGEYIVFVDSDDFIEPKMIEELVKKTENENFELAVCGYNRILINENGYRKKTEVSYGNKVFRNKEELYSGFYPFIDENHFHKIWSKLYISKIIKENSVKFPTELSIGEDFVFNLCYIHYVEKVVFLSTPLYNYELAQNALTNRYDPVYIKNRMKILDYLETFYQNNNLEKSPLGRQYIKSIYAHFMMMNHKENTKSFNEKIEEITMVLRDDKLHSKIENIILKEKKNKILWLLLKIRNPYILLFISKVMKFINMNKKKVESWT